MGWTNDPSPDYISISWHGKVDESFSRSIDDIIKKATPPRDPLQDREVLFALFGGADDITPEMMEDVKAFARFVRQQKAKAQDKGKDGPDC